MVYQLVFRIGVRRAIYDAQQVAARQLHHLDLPVAIPDPPTVFLQVEFHAGSRLVGELAVEVDIGRIEAEPLQKHPHHFAADMIAGILHGLLHIEVPNMAYSD